MLAKNPWIMTLGTILFGGLALSYWPATHILALIWLVLLMAFVLIVRASASSIFTRIKGPGIDLVFRLFFLVILIALFLAQTVYWTYDLPLFVLQAMKPILEWLAPSVFLANFLFSLYSQARGRSVQRERITSPRGLASFFAWVMFFLLPLWIGSVSSAGGLKVTADTSGRTLTPVDRVLFGEIREFARSRNAIGGVAAIITPEGTAYLNYGEFLQGSELAPNKDSIFQVGAISNVFTGLSLARAIENNQITLDTKVRDNLSEELKPLGQLLSEVKILDLVTHTSGLPDVEEVNSFWLKSLLKPHDFYTDLTENSLALGMADMPALSPNQPYQFSNLGTGLLGHVMCQSEGRDYNLGTCYQEIIRRDILLPLGMRDTNISFVDGDPLRVVGAYGPVGLPVPHWSMASLHSAMGLNSSAKDLSSLLEVHLKGRADALGRSIVRATKPTLADDGRGFDLGLAWRIENKIEGANSKDRPLYYYSGATYGNTSFIGFDPVRKIGLVVLFNTATPGLERFAKRVLKEKTFMP